MKVQDILISCKKGTLFEGENTCILFTAKEYPVLFFSMLLSALRSFGTIVPKKLVFNELSFAVIQSQLMTTFLGQKDLLWLGNFSEIEDASFKKQLFAFLKQYEGPHVLMGFVQSDEVLECKNGVIISLDDFSREDKKMMLSDFFPLGAINRVNDFLKMASKISLDQMVMLFYYAAVLGRQNSSEFKEVWFSKIVASEASLFELAQYFFARKSEQFWPVWQKLKQEYAAPFWTIFWSEQLWRAHYVIELYKQNRITEGKQLSFKLPFSFLQRDWKNISLRELKEAHAFLYQGDHAVKNGSSEFFLEVFYASFLTKSF